MWNDFSQWFQSTIHLYLAQLQYVIDAISDSDADVSSGDWFLAFHFQHCIIFEASRQKCTSLEVRFAVRQRLAKTDVDVVQWMGCK